MNRIFFDVDTQLDFLYPAGALYAPGTESIVPQVAALNRYAAEHGIPVISTLDAHTENDPEFRDWPPHCVAGTAGQQKPSATLIEPHTAIDGTRETFDLKGARQILLEKQSVDCFSNANLAALLDHLNVKSCVVYGVFTEICVKNAALGLLKSGRQVALVTDAVRGLDAAKSAQFLLEFSAAGGELTTMEQVTGPP